MTFSNFFIDRPRFAIVLSVIITIVGAISYTGLNGLIKQLKDHYNLPVLMAEQNFTQALRIADRGYVIVHGKIEFEGGSAAELNNNDLIRQFYLGM